MAQIQYRFQKNDEYFTPANAVYPIMKRLKAGAAVWCPFDTKDSAYVKVLSGHGFSVIYGHIQTGQDFSGQTCRIAIILSATRRTAKRTRS